MSFRVKIDKDDVFEFNTYIPSSKTIYIECDVEGKPITIEGTSALPPGFTLHYSNISAKNLPVKVRYSPAEKGVRRAQHVGGVVVLRVVYIDGDDGCEFRLKFEMMEDTGPDPNILTECGLCHAEFDREEHDPKVLECGHTFCLLCLEMSKTENDRQNKLRADQNLTGRILFACPMDRKKINIALEELPTNRLILDSVDKLVDERRKEAAKVVQDPFMPCYEDPRHESDVWCQDCKQTYCNQCATTAHSSKMMKSHKRVPVAEMPIPDIPLCPNHPEKTVTFLCLAPTCSAPDKIFCTLCQKAKTHKGHKFARIGELIKKNKETLDDLHSRLSLSVELLKNRSEGSEKSWKSFEDIEKTNSVRRSIENYHNHKRVNALHNYDRWIEKQKQDLQVEYIRCSSDCKRQESLLKRVSNKRKRKDTIYDIDDILGEPISGMTDQKRFYPTILDYKFPDGMGQRGPVIKERSRSEDRIPVEMPIERPVEPLPPVTIPIPRNPPVVNPGDPIVIDEEDDDYIEIIAY